MSDAQNPMTIAELQQAIDAWIGHFAEGYWPPLANLARLTEEVGELARAINHEHGPKKRRADTGDGSPVAEELADVVIAAATLANSLGLDLGEAVRASLRKVTERDADRWVRKPS